MTLAPPLVQVPCVPTAQASTDSTNPESSGFFARVKEFFDGIGD